MFGCYSPLYLKQLLPLILLLHIRASVDLDQDATRRAAKEPRSTRVVEDLRFHANTIVQEFLIEGMDVIQAVDLQAEVEVFGPDRHFFRNVVQNDVKPIPLEQAALPSRDDLTAEVFLEKCSRLGYVGSGETQVIQLCFLMKIHGRSRIEVEMYRGASGHRPMPLCWSHDSPRSPFCE
jgi:hypothetical protein